MSESIPAGFVPIARCGPFVSSIGPVYYRPTAGLPVVGLRLDARHLNLGGIVHGGCLATVADLALGYVLTQSRRPSPAMVTVSLSTDFLSPGRVGDWLEATVEIQRFGSRLAYASCVLTAGERIVLRATGIFAVVIGPAAVADSPGEG